MNALKTTPHSVIMLATLLAFAACGQSEPSATAMKLTSDAFASNGTIPQRHTCDGENESPQLSWSALPEGTRALALICDDPDAPRGTWVHWVLYSGSVIDDGLDAGYSAGSGVSEGLNDFGDAGYGGPCPPPGKPHRYSFRLYALDAPIDLPKRFDKAALERAMEPHILGVAELVGRYGR